MTSTPPNLLPGNYFSAAVKKGKIESILGRYRTPNPIIRETGKALKSMYKEATTTNPIKKTQEMFLSKEHLCSIGRFRFPRYRC